MSNNNQDNQNNQKPNQDKNQSKNQEKSIEEKQILTRSQWKKLQLNKNKNKNKNKKRKFDEVSNEEEDNSNNSKRQRLSYMLRPRKNINYKCEEDSVMCSNPDRRMMMAVQSLVDMGIIEKRDNPRDKPINLEIRGKGINPIWNYQNVTSDSDTECYSDSESASSSDKSSSSDEEDKIEEEDTESNNYKSGSKNEKEDEEDFQKAKSKIANIVAKKVLVNLINECNRRKSEIHSGGLTDEDIAKIRETEDEIRRIKSNKIPHKHKILLSNLHIKTKIKILDNLERLGSMISSDSEYHKLVQWVDGVMKIPFGKYIDVPVTREDDGVEIFNYISHIRQNLDKCIYGQRESKNKIMQLIAQWISNPNSIGQVIGFCGEKGVGKTSLAKEGIANALGRPFSMISLGGLSDGSTLTGHGYTYEGAICGRIVEILQETECMNPIIFFDELDKVSDTKHGQEIIGVLTHLTDPSQNMEFQDKYFSGINMDLSKALIIFSYNYEHKINPILRDRITQIDFQGFKTQEKQIIARDYMIPKICANVGLPPKSIQFTDDAMKIILKIADKEKGVRLMKKTLETLYMKVNLMQYTSCSEGEIENVGYRIPDFKLPIMLTREHVNRILGPKYINKYRISDSARMMYL